MEETFYNFGFLLVKFIPLMLIIVLSRKVRRNYAEIKRLKEEQKKKEEENNK